ncbi:MAG: nucleotide disphospho-sugar-binding domain-containing protein [Gemmatimonadota bacterium]
MPSGTGSSSPGAATSPFPWACKTPGSHGPSISPRRAPPGYPENRPGSPLPDGVILEPFAPHAALFPRASAVVHQGGAGTLHQGLRSGRPTLVVPFAHDQPDNAYRVERLGVSRTLRPRRYTAARVGENLGILLRDGACRARAEAVAERVRREDGARAACDALEEVLAAGTASR